MKEKIRFFVDIVLVVAAFVAMCYNFNAEQEIAYASSIIAVCGTSAILARDVYQAKVPKKPEQTKKEEKRP